MLTIVNYPSPMAYGQAAEAKFDIEPRAVGKIQILAIFKILSDEAITDQDLDALLGEAAELASRGAGPPGQGAVPPG